MIFVLLVLFLVLLLCMLLPHFVMERCTLKRCWCCIPLRPGTIVIGIVCVISSIASIVFVFVDNDLSSLSFYKIFKDVRTAQLYTCIVNFLGFIVSVLLLIGVQKKNWKLMLPWLIFGAFQIILTVAIFLYLCGDTSIKKQPDIEYYLVGGTIGIAFSIYLWFVPFSYYTTLKESEELRPLLAESM